MNNKTIVIKKLLGLILAVALLFGTVASVADFAYAQPEEDDSPEVVVLQAGQEEPESEEDSEEEQTQEEIDEAEEIDEEELDQEEIDEEELDQEEIEEEELDQEEIDEEELDQEEIEEEEYDPGAMLDGFPATPHPGGGSITWFAPGSLGSALAENNMRMRTRSSSSGLQPGEVSTSKTASPVPGMVNTWDIKVRIEGRDNDKVETTDVVLVIDRSGSMQGSRMTNAKAAANSFIDTMINEDPNLRIAIVSFASNVSINSNYSRSTSVLKGAVNGLNASGGTHTQAGIIQGRSLLTGSNANNKYMVLLSDGEPTYSYEPSNWTNGRPSWGTAGFINDDNQRTGVYDGNFNTGTIVGTGSNLRQSYNYTTGSWPNRITYRRHIDNGAAAIKAGVDTRTGIDGIDGLFTIALDAGSEGTSILEQIASPGMAYETTNPTDLKAIYDEIGTAIQTQNALRNAVVLDEMGDGFSLIDGTLAVTEGTTAVTGAGGGSNQTITWTINPAVDQLVAETDDVRFAEMTYRVEINDDILDLPGAKTNEHQLFETNKVTNLSYLDINDINKQVSIDSPEVDPVLFKIKKNLTNPMKPEDRIFNVEISTEEPNGFNQTVGLVPNADYVWSTKLRHEGTYKVEEKSITGTGFTELDQFDISYEVDGANKDDFVVDHDDQGKPRGDVSIEVTNTEHGDATPDEPLIRVSKTFVGLTQDQIDQLTDFKITITSQSDSTMTRVLFLSQGTRVVETNGDITYKWEIEGWPAGTYNVVETGHELDNYSVDIENDGTVTTEAAEINWTTNLWKKPNTHVNNDLKVNSIPPNIVATKLSSGEGVFVWTETRLSASQRLAIVDALSGWNELGLTMDNGYWYSGDDIEGTDFYFRGYRIQYDFATGNLHIPQPNQWALIVSGAYQFTGGDPADIAVKNSYTLKTVDVTIEKEVTGNLGDKQGAFDFTVQVSGEEEPRTFSLAHGQSETLTGIPANAVLTLTEVSRGHDVTVKVGNNEIDSNGNGSYTINLSDYQGNITIEVTNDRTVTVDTGITLDDLPYVIMLILAGLGALGIFIKRRKYKSE